MADLGKMTSAANKVVLAADGAMQSISKNDLDLMHMNLEKLRITLEEAEEVGDETTHDTLPNGQTMQVLLVCVGFLREGGDMTLCQMDKSASCLCWETKRWWGNAPFGFMCMESWVYAGLIELDQVCQV